MNPLGDALRNKDKGPDLKSKFFKNARKSYEKMDKQEREKYLQHIAVEKSAQMNQTIQK